MPGEAPPTDERRASRRSSIGSFVAELSAARTSETIADRLAEQVVRANPGASVRVYVLGPGDRCASCVHARVCTTRDRCLHLTGGNGSFAQAPVHAERVPRVGNAWARALALDGATRPDAGPSELAAPGTADGRAEVVLASIRSGDVALGVVGVRFPADAPKDVDERLAESAFLSGAALAAVASHTEGRRRFEQLQLVSDLGRKVNSILNPDLLLRQAVVDIQRTFGYRHVTLFVVDRATRRIQLRAQSSRYQRAEAEEREHRPRPGHSSAARSRAAGRSASTTCRASPTTSTGGATRRARSRCRSASPASSRRS